METRQVERLQRSVRRLGVATTGLDRRADVFPPDIERTISEAVEHGVDLIDTAPSLGESERICGLTLRALRVQERVMMIAKVPVASVEAASKELLADEDGVAFRDPLPKVYSPAYLVHCVESSLRASTLEVLPLCLLDGWHDSWLASTAWPEIQGAMAQLKRRGKVLHWGLALPLPAVAHATAILDDPLITAIAAPYSLWSEASATLAQAAAQRGIAFLATMVMGQGGLSGEILATATFRPGDLRNQRFADPVLKIELSRRIAEFAAFTKSIPIAAESSDAARATLETSRRDLKDRECETMPELALRFALSHPAVTAAILGCSSVEHIRANVAAEQLGPLPEHVLSPLRALMAKYVKPAARVDEEDRD
jgi:aryl-alcohol dehydrogenase-like predicted oxidoreductase